MSAPVVLFPDAVAVVTGYLRTEFGSRDESAPVHSRVPSTRPGRFVLVRRVGGPRRDLVSDLPLLTVEAWAQDEADAADLLNLCRGLLGAMRGSVQDGTTVYQVNEVGGPGWLPDPTSDHPRFTMTVEIGMRGVPE